KMLNNAILKGQAKYIFISDKVQRLMLASGEFTWLIEKSEKYEDQLVIIYRNNSKTVYKHLHFQIMAFLQKE
ncbi:MAG: hypothetical protein Q8P34_19310, partial [Bacteroidota bacterium]|nr:hypothetical protein [Bacteroidota bacterium]